jgi:hypothetical protein
MHFWHNRRIFFWTFWTWKFSEKSVLFWGGVQFRTPQRLWKNCCLGAMFGFREHKNHWILKFCSIPAQKLCFSEHFVVSEQFTSDISLKSSKNGGVQFRTLSQHYLNGFKVVIWVYFTFCNVPMIQFWYNPQHSPTFSKNFDISNPESSFRKMAKKSIFPIFLRKSWFFSGKPWYHSRNAQKWTQGHFKELDQTEFWYLEFKKFCDGKHLGSFWRKIDEIGHFSKMGVSNFGRSPSTT